MPGITIIEGVAPTSDLKIGSYGQSLAAFLSDGGGGATFKEKISANTAITYPEIDYFVVGGSSILPEAATNPTNWWYNPDVPENGPQLDGALTSLLATTVKPTHIFWTQGEQDATYINTPAKLARYKAGVKAVLIALQTICNVGSPSSVSVGIQQLRRLLDSTTVINPGGYNYVRQAQQEIVSENPGLGFYIAGETYDVDMISISNAHPTWFGYEKMGARSAENISNTINSAYTPVLGPSITSVTRISSLRLDVAIAVESVNTLVKPANPCCFGVRSDPVTKLGIASTNWNGNTLEITLSQAMGATATFHYPDDAAVDFTPSGLVQYAGFTDENTKSLRTTAPIVI